MEANPYMSFFCTVLVGIVATVVGLMDSRGGAVRKLLSN